MKHFNVQYVKAHPVMFGTIVIVFGLLFWMLLNHRGGGSSSVTVANSGPSDAQVAAGVQLSMAQLGANTQVTLAQMDLAAKAQDIEGQKSLAAMELAYQVQELGAQHDLGVQTIQASLASLTAQLNNNLAVTNSNNQFMLDYAQSASDAATTQLAINAGLQRDLSKDSLDAMKFGTLASTIGTLKAGKRDNAFALLTSETYGGGHVDPAAIMAPNGDHSGGGFNPLGAVFGVAGMIAG